MPFEQLEFILGCNNELILEDMYIYVCVYIYTHTYTQFILLTDNKEKIVRPSPWILKNHLIKFNTRSS